MEIPFNSTSLQKLKNNKGFRWDYELADYLNVDQRTISDWRAGRAKPNYKAIVLMMRAGLTVQEIAGIEDSAGQIQQAA